VEDVADVQDPRLGFGNSCMVLRLPKTKTFDNLSVEVTDPSVARWSAC